MCGFAGFCNFTVDYNEDSSTWYKILQNMNKIQKHRGPDEDGIFLSRFCGMGHVRLSILDLSKGKQPMTRQIGNHISTIVYNGEIYNMPQLRQNLISSGAELTTHSDTEIILTGYLMYGIDFIKQLNGIFAFAIWDESYKILYLCRDRLGVKPLFYTFKSNTLIFSSEIKGILSYPDFKATIDKEGLCEVFGLGPAKTYGKGVFKDVLEVLPGSCLEFKKSSFVVKKYWELESKPHEDNWDTTLEKTRYLVTDAIKMQMLSDVPICTFLSGGIDSSLVTSICNIELKKQNKILDTYSFDFKNNDKNFKSNFYQPTQDRPYVDIMIQYCSTNHQYLECSNNDLFSYLFKAVDARDLPCMADVEASMLYFCEEVARNHKVALTGECADELFGGYPWFHKSECFEADCFPWSMDISPRTMLLKDSIMQKLPLYEYSHEAYINTINEVPTLYGEDNIEKRRREISYLNIKWFMQTLLDRMDRTSMYNGLEARVPFADYRIVEYVWNIPWNMKCKNGQVKGLLREAAVEYLPPKILYRRKCPYPKTYDINYEALLKNELINVLNNNSSPLNIFIDINKVKNYINTPTNYSKPFYGQLMAGPQLLAYLLQINYWIEKYNINICL